MTTITTISSTPTAPTAVSATNPALTYEQLLARSQDHHASALKFAEMAGMELRANGAGFDLFKDYELITESRSALDVSNFLWGYINGRDDTEAAMTTAALLTTADSQDGAANLLRALSIADGYGWTIQIASYGLVVRNKKFAKDFSGLADFFIFADGYGAAIDDHCKVYENMDELETGAEVKVGAEGVTS